MDPSNMDSVLAVPLGGLAALVTCKVCHGFLVDATALPECGHVFCKSCIVRHCERSTVCPLESCRAYIHARPISCLKKDTTLQTLVYKLFPEIYHSEMSRRRLYFLSHAEQAKDARVLDAESRGTAENPVWLPQLNIPAEMEVQLTYKHSLTSSMRRDFPTSLLEKELKATHKDLGTMCHSTVNIEELKCFIVDFFKLTSEISIIVLHGNTVVDNTETMADIMRFRTRTSENRQSITLNYFFLPKEMVPFPSGALQTFVHECFRKDLTLHVPLCGRVRQPKKRGQNRAIAQHGSNATDKGFPNHSQSVRYQPYG